MEALIPTAGAEHGDGEEKEVPRWSSGSDPCQMCTDVPSVPLDSASWTAGITPLQSTCDTLLGCFVSGFKWGIGSCWEESSRALAGLC